MGYCLVVVFLALSSLVDEAHGAIQTTSKSLYDTVMLNYSADVRPVIDENTTLQVELTLSFNGIVQFDELSRSLWTAAWLIIQWNDELLSWNKSDYSDIEEISVPPTKLWTPDITLFNFHDEVAPLTSTKIKADVRFDGAVTWVPGGVFKSKCELDTTLIPFDTQRCMLRFKVWSYQKNKVLLTPFVKKKPLDIHGEWEILLVDCSPEYVEKTRTVIYTVYLRRLPRYILVNTVVPVMLLSVINILVFKIPAAAGERLSYGITTLLSFAVFLSYMSSFLPRNGAEICYLSLYILAMLAQSVAIIMSVIFSLHVCYIGGTSLRWIKLLCKSKTCGGVKVKAMESSVKTTGKISNVDDKGKDGDTDNNEISNGREEYARMTDRFFFYFYIVTFLLMTIIFASILLSAASKDTSGTTNLCLKE